MSGKIEFDEDAARRVEAAYSTSDIAAQRASVISTLALRPGEHVLDVGVGPGFLAAEMAEVVGAGGRVCGIDVSDDMLAVAAKRGGGQDAVAIELAQGGAEAIPYDDGSFDVVVTTQVLEYVADVPRALAEIHRVLKPGGRTLILDTDWDSLVWQAPDRALMTRVLAAWEEHLVDPHLPRTLGRSLEAAGFEAGPPTVLPLLNVGARRGEVQRESARPGRQLRGRPTRLHPGVRRRVGGVHARARQGLVLQPQPLRLPGDPPGPMTLRRRTGHA